MDSLQKEALRKSRVFLVTNLIPDSLWDHLIANGVFTDMMLEYIKCKSPRSEQIRSLLSDLTRRHQGAYEAFIKCLNDTGHEHCAKEIKKNMIDIQIEKGLSPIMAETHEPNPTSGPALGALPPQSQSSQQSSTSDVEMEDNNQAIRATLRQESQQNFGNILPQHPDYWYHKNREPEDVYRMETSPRGMMYIINNQNFLHMPKREGSDKDVEKLRILFRSLGFGVFFNQDLTAQEMRSKLEMFSRFDPLKTADSCVIVILSHGRRHCMYGVDATGTDADSNYVTDDDLKKIFGNKNCPYLHGKPKLFFIQACRGNSEDQGIPSIPSYSTLASGVASSRDGSFIKKDVTPDVLDAPESAVFSSEVTSLPNTTDMVIAHSSVDGFVSYRNPDEGSVFIGEVVNVFKDHAHDTHVGDMLTKVNKRIATQFSTNHGNKMMPQPTNLLLKKWYLNPVNNPVT